jgi:hypothetical protein
MFRCPTCISVLAEPRARRCETCGQNLRRRAPVVLGEAHKVSSLNLPIDRWMAERATLHIAPSLRPVPPMPKRVAAPRTEPVSVFAHAGSAPLADAPIAPVLPIVPAVEPAPAPEILVVDEIVVEEIVVEETFVPDVAVLAETVVPEVAVVPETVVEEMVPEPVVATESDSFSAVAATSWPFVSVIGSIPSFKPKSPPVPASAPTPPPAPAPGEIEMTTLAVARQPVRNVDPEMESALDELARAAREEILRVNAPAATSSVIDAEETATEAPWLAPLRKAWEPPAEEEKPDGGFRWGFRRRTG